MNKKINLNKKKIEARLKMNDEVGKILNLNYQTLHILEENLIIYSQTYVPQKKWDKIDHHLQKILFHSGNILTLFLDTKLKRNFEFLRINFIQNLEKKIIFGKDRDYILTRLGDLNIAWNSFHMRISKGDYKLGKASKKILSSSQIELLTDSLIFYIANTTKDITKSISKIIVPLGNLDTQMAQPLILREHHI